MNLKSGRTLWTQRNSRPPRYPKLRTDITCDVAVIGAGITGALVAHALVRSGLNAVVVDKRAPGVGSTSASTALLLYETDTSLAELAQRHGRAAALRVYALGRRAIRELGGIARSLPIDCGFRPRKTLYLASDRQGWAEIKEEYRLRRGAGMPVTLLTRDQLRAQFDLDFFGAIYSPGSAQVDAMRLAQQVLAHHVRRRKLRVFQETSVTEVKTGEAGVRLRTADCRTIEARHVVVATGYEAAPFLPAGLVQLHSSYVIASRRHPENLLWKDRCLIWETARPYFYLRTTDDGRVLMGGEDEPFADPMRRDAKLGAKVRALQRRFRRTFPHLRFETEFAWTGTFGESEDGLPYIGAQPSAPRIFYALGYGGNGITFSQIAARIVARLCCGRRHRDADLFRFDREKNGKSGTGRTQNAQ